MAKFSILALAAVLAIVSARPPAGVEKDILPEVFMKTPELIKYHGYPVEEHIVQTEDGYRLTMHRIPHGIRQEPSTGRPVVFLQHGLLCSSSDWVIMGPAKGFAYLLADAGYDVWMGNARGNTYSKSHVSLSTGDKEFWDFSWHEMGLYDLPAEIDYVLEQTGQSQTFYAGHSMGTTMFYVMATTRPEYNSKIRAQFSLAPVAYMDGVRTPIRILAPFVDIIEWVIDMIGIGEFLPNSKVLDLIGVAACNKYAITKFICDNVFFLLCGYDSQQLNETMVPVIAGHAPAGTSSKTMIHYAQEINSGKFRNYDYGLIGNMNRYGSLTPPEYNLGLATAPIYLHYSENDLLAGVGNVMELYSNLPNAQGRFDVPFKKFNHLDYLWAIDVKDLLYSKIMSLMASHL